MRYLHNVLGQRVFKGEPTAEQTLPNASTLGEGFVAWLMQNFGWLFSQEATTSLGTAYVFGDGEIPNWALLGEYGNGGSTGAGRGEYIWLPLDDGSAIPIGFVRGTNVYAVHSDHLGTPRLMTHPDGRPVWQWAYSAFGANKPTGVLKETTGPNQQGGAPLLRATAATELNLRFPGQYFESEAGSFYNYFRSYQATTGRYTQADPIGLEGGWSRFGYASADSFDFVDPDGRIALPALAPLLPLIPAACNLSPGYRGLFDRDGGKMYIKPPRNAHDPHGGTGKADRSGWLQGSKMR